jgi:hypothetical protein
MEVAGAERTASSLKQFCRIGNAQMALNILLNSKILHIVVAGGFLCPHFQNLRMQLVF